jgi:nucleoside-diphosphate-sugar epimerase
MSKDTARQHMPSEIVGFWTQEGWFDIGKARTMLGYEPRISLDEGMKLTEAWLREAGYLS